MKIKYLITIVAIVALTLYFFMRDKDPRLPPVTGTNVIVIGDSLAYGIGSTKGNDFVSLLSARVSIPIVNMGIPGDTTADVLKRLSRDVLERDPRVVVIVIGGNDFLRHIPKEETLSNIRRIVEQIKATGARVILVGTSRFVYDVEYQEIAKELEVIFVPHVMDRILYSKNLMADRVHPNDKGYVVFANTIEPYLIKALKE
jgi:acyl-CoA thioesterase I